MANDLTRTCGVQPVHVVVRKNNSLKNNSLPTDFSKNKKSVADAVASARADLLNSNQHLTIKERTNAIPYQCRTVVERIASLVNYSTGGLYNAGLNRMKEGGR
jgi:hypothetical protein